MHESTSRIGESKEERGPLRSPESTMGYGRRQNKQKPKQKQNQTRQKDQSPVQRTSSVEAGSLCANELRRSCKQANLPLYQLICFPVWLVVSGSSAVSNSFVSGLWQLICLPIWLVVSGFGCLQFICLGLWQLICLPVWLVVSGSSAAVSVTLVMSGSLAVSNLFVSKSGWWRLCLPNNSFVSQSGWWCPAFRLAPIHLSPLVTLHLSPSLAGGVRLSGCLQFICFRLVAIHLSPSLAGGVRLSMLSAVSNSFVFPCGN